MVLGYFLLAWDTPNPPKNKKNSPSFFFEDVEPVPQFFFDDANDEDNDPPHVLHFFKLLLGAKPLEARGKAASKLNSRNFSF